MLKISYATTIIILLLVSCKSENKKLVSQNKIIISNMKDETIGNLLTHTINHELVCLETDKESLISDITDIRSTDKRFYIYDKRQKSIFVFSKNGKFITKINRLGKSRSEYLGIKSFDINDNGDIVILDNIGMKLLLINSLGKVKRSIILAKKSDYEIVSFLSDSTFCITSKGVYEKYIGNDYMLHTFDMTGSLLYSELSFGDGYNNLIIAENFNHNIYRKNNELHINFPFSNKIFVKSPDSLYCKTEIVFEGMDDIESLYKKSDDFKHNGVIASLKTTNIITLGVPFIDKDNYILTNIHNSNSIIKYLLYNKTNKMSSCYNFNLSKKDALMISKPIIYNGDKNKLITIISPSDIMKILNEGIEYKNEIHKTLISKFKEINIVEEQNPILLIFELVI